MIRLLFTLIFILSVSSYSDSPPPQMLKILEAKCISCHGEDKTKGDLDLIELLKSKKTDMKVWQKVYNAVSTETMPPVKKKPLTEDELDIVMLSIKNMSGKEIPTTKRLLTPAEIKYTIYDLFEADRQIFDPSINLKTNYSFDSFHTMQRNKISSHYLDNLFHAFNETVNSYAFVQEVPKKLKLKPIFWQGNHSGAMHDKKLYLRGKWKDKINEIFFDSPSEKKIPVLPPGKYKLTFDAVVENNDFTKIPKDLRNYLENTVKGGITHIAFYARPFRQTDEFGKQRFLKLFKMDNTKKKTYSFEFTLNRKMAIGLIFDNGPNEHSILDRDTITVKDSYKPIATYDRKEYPFIQVVLSNYKIAGPYDIQRSKVSVKLTENQKAISKIKLNAKFENIYKQSGIPLQTSHLRVFGKFNDKMELQKAYRYALVNLLMSPEFLNITNKQSDRLKFTRFASYSLLKSPPSEEFSTKFNEFIKEDDSDKFASWLVKQTEFERFISTFVTQWLKVEKIQNALPDPERFPEYYKNKLYEKFLNESSHLLLHVFQNNLPVAEIYTADYSFVNEELFSFYKSEKIKIDYKNLYSKQKMGQGRGGLLSHGSFLTSNSNGVEPLPITRAVWILENVFDHKLPEPPANIDVEEFEKAKSLSFKDKLKTHSQNSSCYSCHKKIDPIAIIMNESGTIGRNGFSDKFDAVEIDGMEVNSYASFKKYIKKNDEKVARAFVKKLIEFTQGRYVLIQDEIKVDKIFKALKGTEFNARNLLAQIIKQYYLVSQ